MVELKIVVFLEMDKVCVFAVTSYFAFEPEKKYKDQLPFSNKL